MQTVFVKLETSDKEAEALIQTMHQFNAPCNEVPEVPFHTHTANKIKLQKEVYYSIKERYNLSAQMAIRVIAKVPEVYKRDRSIQPTFKPEGAMNLHLTNL